MTNQTALSTESGLGPAVAHLNNRQRRFATRLLNLPQGNQATEAVGASSATISRLETALEDSGEVFFCLIILAFDLPFCPPPRPFPRMCGAHQDVTKGKKASVQNKRKDIGKASPNPPP